MDKRIQTLFKNNIDVPLSYTYLWAIKNFWDDVPEFISQKYAEAFYKKTAKNHEEEKQQPEIIEEVVVQDEARKNPTKYEYWLNRMGNWKSKLVNTSNHVYQYYYAKKLAPYEKEFSLINNIITSSVSNDIPEISFPHIIKETIKHLDGLNKELDSLTEKIPNIDSDELHLSFKKNYFSEILKQYLNVNILKRQSQFLFKSKDDNLILMIAGLLYTIFIQESIPSVIICSQSSAAITFFKREV